MKNLITKEIAELQSLTEVSAATQDIIDTGIANFIGITLNDGSQRTKKEQLKCLYGHIDSAHDIQEDDWRKTYNHTISDLLKQTN